MAGEFWSVEWNREPIQALIPMTASDAVTLVVALRLPYIWREGVQSGTISNSDPE
jgi:hypothetical protein